MSTPTPTPDHQRRTAVLIDYPNMHATGYLNISREENAKVTKNRVAVDPTKLAQLIVDEHHKAHLDEPVLDVTQIHVYRSIPDSEVQPLPAAMYRAQVANWEADDPRVTVHGTPLRYKPHHRVPGKRVPVEKGVDVLMAVSGYDVAVSGDVDTIIFATHDSDLDTAEEFIARSGRAEVATAGWERELCPTRAPHSMTDGTPMRHVLLPAWDYVDVLDRRDYSDIVAEYRRQQEEQEREASPAEAR